MPLIIEDQILKEAGLSEHDAKVEFACRLFQANRLTKVIAAKVAGLDRVGFELELVKRGIDPFGYSVDEFRKDLETLSHFSGKP